MDEAQALADRVAVIAAGRIVAEGPPDQLAGRNAATEIRFTPSPPGHAARPGRRGDVTVDERAAVVVRAATPRRRSTP